MKLWHSLWPSALAPMQDVTGLPFIRVIAERGAPDLLFTEFFRVHENSKLDPEILSSITQNPSGSPIFAQLIGESIPNLCRVAEALNDYPIAGIDLNMGCPAPRVYRKNVGGGLLREPAKIFSILEALKPRISSKLTVKMRIGFENDSNFESILGVLKEVGIDLLSLHARTVKGGYRSIPDHSYVARAVELMDRPVLLNGNVTSAEVAFRLKHDTGATGVMIGRSAIRNPWIFQQIQNLQVGEEMFRPTMKDLYSYVCELFRNLKKPNLCDRKQVARIKKFLNFVGLSVCPEGKFLHSMRRAENSDDLFTICRHFMISEGRAEKLMPLEPYSNLVARPSQETCSAGQSLMGVIT